MNLLSSWDIIDYNVLFHKGFNEMHFLHPKPSYMALEFVLKFWAHPNMQPPLCSKFRVVYSQQADFSIGKELHRIFPCLAITTF